MPSLFIISFRLGENTEGVSMKILSNFLVCIGAGDALLNIKGGNGILSSVLISVI